MNRGDSLDYVVLDVATAWQRLQQERQEAKNKGLPPPAPNLSVNKMKEMIERVRR